MAGVTRVCGRCIFMCLIISLKIRLAVKSVEIGPLHSCGSQLRTASFQSRDRSLSLNAPLALRDLTCSSLPSIYPLRIGARLPGCIYGNFIVV